MMGIFDGKRTEEIEKNIVEALKTNRILDVFTMTFQNSDDSLLWLTNVINYYESRKRTICVGDDFINVWGYDSTMVFSDRTKKLAFGLRYTDMGFYPIHAHKNEKGKIDIPKNRVIELWATLIKERLAQILPTCEFTNVLPHSESSTINCYYFEYIIPPLHWDDWF